MQNLPGTIAFLVLLQSASSSWAQAEVQSSAPPGPVAGQTACDEGSALSRDGDAALSLLYLERCHRSAPSAEIRQLMSGVRKTVTRAHKTSAPVSLAFTPAIATAKLHGPQLPDAYVGVLLLDEDELRLPPGRYEIEVQASGYEGGRFAVEVESADRMLVPISLKEAAGVTTTEIDMSAEPGAELGQVANTPDPRPKKFKTLLAKRYRRAPTPKPIPQAEPTVSGPGPWPWVSASMGAAALATGVVLHSRDSLGPAIAGYGAGAALGGLATYLFLRKRSPEPSPVSLSVGRGQAAFVWQGRWD